MRYSIIVLALLLFLSSIAQDFKEKTLNTEITEATVYIQGAQIKRKGQASIPKGISIIKLEGLSPYINGKSISVKAEGDFIVLSVNHQLNYLNRLKKDARVDSLLLAVEKIDLDISRVQNKIEVFQEKQSLLNANKKLGGNGGVTVAELRQAVIFFEEQTQSLKEGMLNQEIKRKRLIEMRTQLQKAINEVNSDKIIPTSEIEIRVKSTNSTTGKFEVTYPVENAGWFPRYDVRVETISKPMRLEYKADVFQNTGVDWKNVKLSLSTADPNKSGVLPNLTSWYLNYERNTRFKDKDYSNPNALFYNDNEYRAVSGRVTDDTGEGLPGVNVVVRGTTRGTTTDLDGDYQLTVSGSDQLVFSFVGFESQEINVNGRSTIDLSMGGVTELQEVVAKGHFDAFSDIRVRGNTSISGNHKAEVITTSTIQNQTSFTFELDIPFSVKSNGEKLTVDLDQHEINADYQYYTIPKLDADAFLIAQMVGWDKFNLLEGEANLFFEGTFVGQTILNPRAFNDTLDISLGIDKSISIERTKIDDFSKRRTLGSNKIDSRGFKIKIRNQKDQVLKLKIFDQIPVSAISDISIDAVELSGGKLDEKSGKVTWELELKPNEQIELILHYEVKYPKRERVILE
jgi:hypothetical protein